MPRHSKNNTNASFFTYSERQNLSYGTQEQRVGADSLRAFDACYLCLRTAREPLACEEGHLACKECLYENILAQKDHIAKQKRLLEAQAAQRVVDARQVELQAGERAQAAFIHRHASASFATEALAAPLGDRRGLTSFWVPSLTPSAAPTRAQDTPSQVLCTLGGHPLSLKRLVSVHFTYEGTEPRQTPVCPGCRKGLTNVHRLTLSRQCGHVVCQACAQSDPADACFVCQKPYTRTQDLITLSRDGTGFAAGGGKVVLRKYDVAFQ